LTLKVFFTAKFLGKMLYHLLYDFEALIDARLIVISTAFIQAGKCDIDRGMVVAAINKTLNLIFV